MPEDQSHSEDEATIESPAGAEGIAEEEPQLPEDVQLVREELANIIADVTEKRRQDPTYVSAPDSATNIRSHYVHEAKDRRDKYLELGRNYLADSEDEETLLEHDDYVARNQRQDTIIRAAGSMSEALKSASLEELRGRYKDQLERAQQGEIVHNDTPVGTNAADLVVSKADAEMRLELVDWFEKAA